MKGLQCTVLLCLICTGKLCYGQLPETKETIVFDYDAAGNRITKRIEIEIKALKVDSNAVKIVEESLEIVCYPTVTNSVVNLSVRQQGGETTNSDNFIMQCISMSGAVVMQHPISRGSTVLSMSNLARGRYTITVLDPQTKERLFTEAILKQ